MKRPRRLPPFLHPRPPIPREDAAGRRAELDFHAAAFADPLWRRPTPL